MRVLGILKYECNDTAALLSRLTKREEERLFGKAEKYILGSAMGRLLLFSLFRDIFGEDNALPEVADRFLASGEKTGAPYLVGYPQLSVSISHTDGACAVLISDEGDSGVDIESHSFSQNAPESTINKILNRFYLGDFNEEAQEKNENMKTIIYIYDDENGILRSNQEKEAVKRKEKTDENTESFLLLYTRMEALAKASGLGVSFLPKREKYLKRSKIQTLFYDRFVVSVATLL